MKTKDITPAEYAKIKGCSEQNIGKHIRNGNALKLPYVLKLKKFNRFYLLEVTKHLSKENYKTNLIKYKKNNL